MKHSDGNNPSSLWESGNATDGKSSGQAESIEAMKAWSATPTKWTEKRSGSVLTPQTSPRTILQRAKDRHLAGGLSRRSSLVKSTTPRSDSRTDSIWTNRADLSMVSDDPKRGSELHRSMSDQIEGSHQKDSQKPRLASFTGESSQNWVGQTAISADGDAPPKALIEYQDSGRDSQLQAPDPIDAHTDDNGITNQGLGSRALSIEQRSDHTLSNSSKSDWYLDRTNDRDIETVSDKNNATDDAGTSSETHPCSNNNERGRFELHPRVSEPDPALVDARSVRDTAKAQINTKTAEIKEAFDATPSPIAKEDISHNLFTSPRNGHRTNLAPQNQNKDSGTAHVPGAMERKVLDWQRISSRGDNVENPNQQSDPLRTENVENSKPQSNSPKNEQIKSHNPEPHLLAAKGVTDETNLTRDQTGENIELGSWFENDAPLPGNYKTFLRDTQIPRLYSPRRSCGSVDALIISPTKTEEYWRQDEEDYAAITRANAENMEVFDSYRALFQLKPTFDEDGKKRAARVAEKANRKSRRRNPSLRSISTLSSDTSLIVSPVQYNDKSRSISEIEYDGLQKARDEEENEAALHRIELYRVNYHLQKTLEAQEAKFKRDIKTAWTHSRPPPTTYEEHLDRRALEKIESVEIFDEFGNQQRPIRTDPRWVTRETQINMMIARAQIQHVLEDYRQMYNHANHAAEAASKLEFAPLTARCCFYRGLVLYLHRDFSSAKDEFLKARDCAGLYEISEESIERYIHLTDSAQDEATAILEKIPVRKVNGARKTRRTGKSTEQVDETANFQPQNSHKADHIAELSPPPNNNPQMTAHGGANSQPQYKAVSVDLRKDIQGSGARNLSIAVEVGPAEANSQERETVPRSSTVNTELALLGSMKSPSTEEFSPGMRPFASSQANPGAGYLEEKDSGDPDEMDPEKIYTYYGGRPKEHREVTNSDLSPDSDSDSDSGPV